MTAKSISPSGLANMLAKVAPPAGARKARKMKKAVNAGKMMAVASSAPSREELVAGAPTGFDLEVWRRLQTELAAAHQEFNYSVTEEMFGYSDSHHDRVRNIRRARKDIRTLEKAIKWYRAEYLDEIEVQGTGTDAGD